MDTAYMLGQKLTKWCKYYEFVPPLDKVFDARLASGTTSEEELSALKDTQATQIWHRKKAVPDVFGMSTGPFIISPKVRAFLEEHEAGVHRYFPIQIKTTSPQNCATDHGTHWLLFPPPRIDCLNFELTIFVKDAQGNVWSRDRTDTNGRSAWTVLGGTVLGATEVALLDGAFWMEQTSRAGICGVSPPAMIQSIRSTLVRRNFGLSTARAKWRGGR